MESVHHLLPEVGQWYFQHDNSPIHKEYSVKKWLHDNGVTVLDFPPYSPDMMPIENLFRKLKLAVESHHPTTLEELQDAVHIEWNKIDNNDIDYLEHIIYSMPSRLQKVRDADGNAIHH